MTANPVQLKIKLEKAIAAARERGLDTSVWQEKLSSLIQAQEVAAKTYELLEKKGWCLWRCRNLDDEVIVVVRDELVSGYPEGYAVYTDQELEYLSEASSSTLRLVHQAKKTGGALVIGVDEGK